MQEHLRNTCRNEAEKRPTKAKARNYKLHKCPRCDRMCESVAVVDTHIHQVHDGEVAECQWCHKSIAIGQLWAHQTSCTSQQQCSSHWYFVRICCCFAFFHGDPVKCLKYYSISLINECDVQKLTHTRPLIEHEACKHESGTTC